MATSPEIDLYFNVAVKLAQTAGEVIRKAIDEKKNVETKSSELDFVTETDKKVEEFLKAGFSSNFPDHCFIGEESGGGKLTDAPTWIIDPVDGTMNFVHRFPYNAVSIGLAVNKQIVLGVVYNPVLDRMFTGVRGKGAFLNGKKLQVSNVQELSQALIVSGCTRKHGIRDLCFTNLETLVDKAHGVRMLGSATLSMCTVAAGEADAYFAHSIHCWDMAAAKIIVEEAGGTCIDPEGGDLDIMARGLICASSSALAETLSRELKHVRLPRDE